MTDARAMPWSEARAWIVSLLGQCDNNPVLSMDGRCITALEAAIALGDRCAQAEQERERESNSQESSGFDSTYTDAVTAWHDRALVLQKSLDAANDLAVRVRTALWKYLDGRDLGGDRTIPAMIETLGAQRDEARENRRGEYELRAQAEAEAARLREELQVAIDGCNGWIGRTLKAEEQLALVQTQVAALTQERDALRMELLERDDMREGV